MIRIRRTDDIDLIEELEEQIFCKLGRMGL